MREIFENVTFCSLRITILRFLSSSWDGTSPSLTISYEICNKKKKRNMIFLRVIEGEMTQSWSQWNTMYLTKRNRAFFFSFGHVRRKTCGTWQNRDVNKKKGFIEGVWWHWKKRTNRYIARVPLSFRGMIAGLFLFRFPRKKKEKRMGDAAVSWRRISLPAVVSLFFFWTWKLKRLLINICLNPAHYRFVPRRVIDTWHLCAFITFFSLQHLVWNLHTSPLHKYRIDHIFKVSDNLSSCDEDGNQNPSFYPS